jgi:NhaA family Na+:H+ antiporter
MIVFFLVVGLEIKRGLTDGHLSSRRAALLPGVAALGGMLVPALVYLAIAGTSAPRGWAIPMATDIALAVGVLAVAGSRIPASLRAAAAGIGFTVALFITELAVTDPVDQSNAKLAILVASVLAAAGSSAILTLRSRTSGDPFQRDQT